MNYISKDGLSIRKMFNEISPTYDILNHILTANLDKSWRRKAVTNILLQKKNFKCILDLASGTGDFTKEFLRLNPERICSADFSFEMLKLNKNKLSSAKHFIIQADAAALPFCDGSFDLIGIAFGVRNFENLGKCLSEIYRVLKKGGVFITLEMFSKDSREKDNKLFGYYFRYVVSKVGNLVSGSQYAYNYLSDSVDKFDTVREYSNLLIKNKFNVISLINNFQKIVYTITSVKE